MLANVHGSFGNWEQPKCLSVSEQMSLPDRAAQGNSNQKQEGTIWIVVVVSRMYTYVKIHHPAPFKCVLFYRVSRARQ